ncbi:hypothetical protein Micbo1qcDRAFT_170306 [Microdochium bolleyi]|uniref:Uncharacterized protein n=1 Tax=Microdochium bolleyi TaxID=196109 RepID=A0A136JH49_9PEZI|nr:hypothetical protein Micbo1qcDRAFT_170306 [Microdochium bolleyi]
MSSPTGLLQLPVELIVAITGHIRNELDISRLSRSHPVFRAVVQPLLYRHNVRYGKSRALLEGVVCGDLATAEKALDMGGADITTVWSTVDLGVITRRILAQTGGGGGEKGGDRRERVHRLWNDYAQLRGLNFTAVDFAALYQRPGGMRMLLQRGAVPESSLLHMVAHVGDEVMLDILLQHRSNNTTLREHYHGTGYRANKTLLELAIDGTEGKAHLRTARVILKHDPDAARELGDSLIRAEQSLFEAFVTLLNAHGARIHEWQCGYGGGVKKLCSLATDVRDLTKLRFLLATGLTTCEEVRNEVQQAPQILHRAAEKGEAERLRFFLGLGLDDATIQSRDCAGGMHGWSLLASALRSHFSWPRIDPKNAHDTAQLVLDQPAAKPLVGLKVKDSWRSVGRIEELPVRFYCQRAVHDAPARSRVSNDAARTAVDESESAGSGDGSSDTKEDDETLTRATTTTTTTTAPWCARTLQILIDAEADLTTMYEHSALAALANALNHGCPEWGRVVLAHFSHAQILYFLADFRIKNAADARSTQERTEKLVLFERLVEKVHPAAAREAAKPMITFDFTTKWAGDTSQLVSYERHNK